ncbi:hypothetical protein PpBr36_07217 [Pyricularia pennisetigena]|uniref:hypothetical protein n=1 Tax=Pyricularia pennisetigena TaxID=1578925 RepID=UPI00114F8B08|nr:hypothetical protein PpBr36_07217 [Pyricularia pennisetigena]TLS25425.1 hypothetical protein PpBr36_07217 [Pyricularia pennisetigena]
MAAAAMATQQLRLQLPRLSFLSSTNFATTYIRQLSMPLFPSVKFALPAISLGLPSIPSIPALLGEIWEGILKAVPKKKTSHMKKRHRQMAGKALKDQTAICKCPACGGLKRMHYLCPFCTEKIKKALKESVDDHAEPR